MTQSHDLAVGLSRPENASDSVHHAIAAVVARAPRARCLQHGDTDWTYGALWRHSGRLAVALSASGVSPGDRVAAMVEKSAHTLALYLGCLRAGAVYLPLNTSYSDPEAVAILADAQPALLITTESRAAGLRDALAKEIGSACDVLTLEADGTGTILAGDSVTGGTSSDVARAASDPAAMLYTSGTTGRPKGVVLSHGNLTSNADILVDAWRFSDRDVLLHVLPIFHVHGLFVALHTALFSGARVHLLDRFDAATVVRHLPGSTVFMGVPTYYSRLLAEPGLTREACMTLRLFTSGSAPLSPETHRVFEKRTGHTILERYGMTEAGMITANPYDGPRLPGSVGYPLPGVDARVVDCRGRPLGDGEVGVLEIRGPSVFPGYWRRPDADTEAFREDGFLITGDLVRRDADGRTWIVGRAKDLIISGGLNVYPAEVENTIDTLAGVAESAVIGVPHPDFGEGVVAVIAPEVDAELDADAIHKHLTALLASYKRPKRIVLVASLPRNAMGKVQKSQLRDRYRILLLP